MAQDKGYVPPPSIGHELGVMFGFIGFMVLSFVVYAVIFSIYNKRWEKKEQDRLAALRASGYGPVDEKKHQRYHDKQHTIDSTGNEASTTIAADGTNGR